MLIFDPEERITSEQALKHPFFKGMKTTKIKSISKTHKQKGGAPSFIIMTPEEYRSPTNQSVYLKQIVSQNLAEPLLVPKTDKKTLPKISHDVWNKFMSYTKNLRPITINYAICLFYRYIQAKSSSSRSADYLILVITCLFISMKLCEHNIQPNIYYFNQVKDIQQILDSEPRVLKAIDYQLPVPLMVTLDVPLYDRFLDEIYGSKSKSKLRPGMDPYKMYRTLTNLSTLILFSPEFVSLPKTDLINLIMDNVFPSPSKNINQKRQKKLSHMISEFLIE